MSSLKYIRLFVPLTGSGLVADHESRVPAQFFRRLESKRWIGLRNWHYGIRSVPFGSLARCVFGSCGKLTKMTLGACSA